MEVGNQFKNIGPYQHRHMMRYRKYIAHDIHSWAFSYLKANILKYFHIKVACCPWKHTLCNTQGTYTLTKLPYYAVSHETLTQAMRFDVLYFFIVISFMIKHTCPQTRRLHAQTGNCFIGKHTTLQCIKTKCANFCYFGQV